MLELILIGASVLVVVLVVMVICAIARRIKRQSDFAHWARQTELAWREIVEFTLSLVQQHSPALCAQRRLKLYKDPYGRLIVDGWVREIEYFVEHILLSKLREMGAEQNFLAVRNAYAFAAWNAGKDERVINRYAGDFALML